MKQRVNCCHPTNFSAPWAEMHADRQQGIPRDPDRASLVISCRFHGVPGTASCSLGMTVPTGTVLSFLKKPVFFLQRTAADPCPSLVLTFSITANENGNWVGAYLWVSLEMVADEPLVSSMSVFSLSCCRNPPLLVPGDGYIQREFGYISGRIRSSPTV